tara:strand:+ start:406 stop:522 length:117 start_codon:yes stop_codon:yes gene_type:complete
MALENGKRTRGPIDAFKEAVSADLFKGEQDGSKKLKLR